LLKNAVVTGSKIRLNPVYSFLHVAASTSETSTWPSCSVRWSLPKIQGNINLVKNTDPKPVSLVKDLDAAIVA